MSPLMAVSERDVNLNSQNGRARDIESRRSDHILKIWHDNEPPRGIPLIVQLVDALHSLIRQISAESAVNPTNHQRILTTARNKALVSGARPSEERHFVTVALAGVANLTPHRQADLCSLAARGSPDHLLPQRIESGSTGEIVRPSKIRYPVIVVERANGIFSRQAGIKGSLLLKVSDLTHDQGPFVFVLQGEVRAVVDAKGRWKVVVEHPSRHLKRRVDLIHDLRAPFDAGRRSEERSIVHSDVGDLGVEAAVDVMPQDRYGGKLIVWSEASG